jgi:hypothetical protein
MLRNLNDPLDLQSQLDGLLLCVWQCEKNEARFDRLNAVLDRDEHLKRMKESHDHRAIDDRFRR